MIDTVALREKVLDLAIRGKLVPQDPNDEPASVLLERIRAQKQQMVKEGKLKTKDIKDDSIIFVGEDNLHYEKFADGTVKCIEDEIPFELPKGWAWCRLSMVGTTNIGLTYKPADVTDTGTIVLRSCNIRNGKINLEDLVRVKTDIRDNQYIEKNDILICARNGSRALVGKCAIMNNIGERASFGAFMAVYRSSCYRYVYHYFNTLLFRSAFDNDDSKQINQVTQAILRDTMIPLPPFAEQERIVNTLDEALSLIELVNEETENIELLIKNTKSHILDLAIRGKLVPQNYDDEPASVLLERIRAEKEELIQQGKIKRDKKESIIFKGEDNSYYEKFDNGVVNRLDDELPFDIPESWCWCRLKDLFNVCSAKRVLQSEWKKEGIPFYRAREIVKLSNEGYVDNDLYISLDHFERLQNNYGVPQAGDLMVTGVGTIGKVYIVKSQDVFYYKDASVLCFENCFQSMIPEFAKMLMESTLLQTQIHSQTYGNTVDTITISTANDYLCVTSPKSTAKNC